MPNFHRVVITGIGAVTPIGNNIDEYLVGLQAGTNGVSDITLFDPEQHPCKFAAEVKNLQSENFIEAKESKRWDRFSQFGVCLLYTSPSPRDTLLSRMPSSA